MLGLAMESEEGPGCFLDVKAFPHFSEWLGFDFEDGIQRLLDPTFKLVTIAKFLLIKLPRSFAKRQLPNCR